MTMRISVQIDSAAAQAQLRRWGGEFRDKVEKAVARAIASEAVIASAPTGLATSARNMPSRIGSSRSCAAHRV